MAECCCGVFPGPSFGWFLWFSCRSIYRSSHGMGYVKQMTLEFDQPPPVFAAVARRWQRRLCTSVQIRLQVMSFMIHVYIPESSSRQNEITAPKNHQQQTFLGWNLIFLEGLGTSLYNNVYQRVELFLCFSRPARPFGLGFMPNQFPANDQQEPLRSGCVLTNFRQGFDTSWIARIFKSPFNIILEQLPSSWCDAF